MKKHTLQQVQAIALQQKIETTHRHELAHLVAGNQRQAYNTMLQAIDLQTQLQAIYDSHNKTPLEIVSISIALHSLKVLARGRKYTNKNNEIVYTPANVQAQKLLEQGHNDTSGIIEDLISAVTLEIWQAMASDKLTIIDTITDNGTTYPRLTLANPDDTATMRTILNVVQKEFYQNQQKHFTHEYRPTIDDDGNESDVMITAAMREWEKSIEFIGENELFNSLSIQLTERETMILRAKLQQKQVERSYTSHGMQKRHYVTRYFTLDEIAVQLNLSKMQVRTALANIKIKCENLQKQ